MDDCGAILHNIETKWLYDFLTLEKCRNFSQAAVSRNVSQPAFSRRIRALEQAIGVELFNRQVTPLQLSEQGKIFHSQIRHLLQQLESNLAELRGGSDYAQRKIKIAAAHSLSLGLLPSIISQMPPLFTWAIEAIDVDEAVDKLREGQSDCIFSFHDEDLLEAPFDHIRLFESQLFPVCASDEHGEALFNLAQPHFPLLNYSRNSYMGRCTLSSLFPSGCYRPLSARCRRSLPGQLKLLMSMKRSINCVKGKVTVFFPFTTKICWKRRLTTFAYLNLNCSLSAPVTNTEKHFLTSRSHTFRY